MCPLDGTDPLYDRNEVHEIYAEWREVFNSYDPPRTAVAEAYAPSERRALYARPDLVSGQAFNFDLLKANFSAGRVPRRDHLLPERGGEDRLVLDLGAVQSRRRPPHIAVRAARRYRLDAWLMTDGLSPAPTGGRLAPGPGGDPADAGAARLGVPLSGRGTRPARGLRPAADRAAGSDLAADANTKKGRDGCRVPLPWSVDGHSYGFGVGPA